jgi:hypothetical protein
MNLKIMKYKYGIVNVVNQNNKNLTL